MRTIIKMAWRNIWRNWRRTVITSSAVALGLAVLIMAFCLTEGILDDLGERVTEGYIGHIQIHKKGYQKKASINKRITNPKTVMNKLRGNSSITAYAPRIIARGLISSADNSVNVTVLGIDPEREKKLSNFDDHIFEGKYVAGPKDIFIGERIAAKLKVGLGDRVVIMSQSLDREIGSALFRVSGIFKIGSREMDGAYALIHIESAQKILSFGDDISEIALRIEALDKVDEVSGALKEIINQPELEILTWKEIVPFILSLSEMADAEMYIFLFVISFIALLGILNTILMSVIERIREFGVMMALGTRPSHIALLIFTESVFIGVLNVTFGLALGVLTGWYLQVHGIDYSMWMDSITLSGIAIEPVFYGKITFGALMKPASLVFVMTLVSSVYPVIKIFKLTPVNALKHI